jgi:sugar/nucleoside kinase (ribokinase family)
LSPPPSDAWFDVYSLGSSIVLKIVAIAEEELQGLGIAKATMAPADGAAQAGLLARFPRRRVRICPGGSAENTVHAMALMGGSAAFAGAAGGDRMGDLCRSSLRRRGVTLTAPPKVGRTGVCLVLVTPDGERAMRTDLGISGALAASDVRWDLLARSSWLFLESYLLASPIAREAVFATIDYARRRGVRIALSLSSRFIVETCREELTRAMQSAHLVLANELEATSYTRRDDPLQALEVLCQECPAACVTVGARGSYIRFPGIAEHVRVTPVAPVDTTGAGDLYAAGVLYGLTHGFSPIQAARLGSQAASRVVRQWGPRLPRALLGTVRRAQREVPAQRDQERSTVAGASRLMRRAGR